jgi:hypothetical protein
MRAAARYSSIDGSNLRKWMVSGSGNAWSMVQLGEVERLVIGETENCC